MRRIATKRARSRATSTRDDSDTRQRLLEVAGQIFADKGFGLATGKEICERAGTNTAAVNYYFGGMEGLYAAVVEEAHSRFITFEAVSAAVAGKGNPKAKLEAVVGLLVQALTGPTSSSWALRVLGREVLAPSFAFDVLRDKEFLPKTRILRAIVGGLMGLPEDHPAVARGCISVMAPGFLLMLFDRHTLQLAFPALGLAPDQAEALGRHFIQFAEGGLAAVASAVRKEIVDSE